jgi:hypothetical protein
MRGKRYTTGYHPSSGVHAYASHCVNISEAITIETLEVTHVETLSFSVPDTVTRVADDGMSELDVFSVARTAAPLVSVFAVVEDWIANVGPLVAGVFASSGTVDAAGATVLAGALSFAAFFFLGRPGFLFTGAGLATSGGSGGGRFIAMAMYWDRWLKAEGRRRECREDRVRF